MMKAINFKLANTTLKGFNDVEDLPILKWNVEGYPHVLSCWKASFKERLAVLFTGKVWFFCQARTHPPILLTGETPKWQVPGKR